MSLTKTNVDAAITVVTEVIAKKKEEVKALQKAKKGADKVKEQVANLTAVKSILAKELKALDKPKKASK